MISPQGFNLPSAYGRSETLMELLATPPLIPQGFASGSPDMYTILYM